MWKLLRVALGLLLCSNTLQAQTITYPGAVPGFCPGGQIILTASNPPIGTFEWKNAPALAGPYGVVGGNTPSLAVNATGWYTVSVSGNPITYYDTIQVTQNPKPVANFTFTGNNSCSGSSIPFTSNITSGTAPFTYAWDFGDATSSTAANPSHVFTSLGCGTGNFNVRLIVTDARGCKDTVNNTVAVLQRPDVNIADVDIFSPFSNCDNNPTPTTANFTLTVNNVSPSAGCITSYTINWGDGNTQTNVTFPAAHTYTQLGAFNLQVTAFGSNGCNSTRTYVVGNQSNPAGGLATLGATTGLCVPSIIPFIITNWENNSPGTTYQLDLGDGVIQTLTHPLNATNLPHTVNHQYTTSSCPQATYTATLTVINACDQTPYTAGNIQIRLRPAASFTVQPNPGCAGQNICFTNTTVAGNTGPTCSPVTAYSWDFGDPASGVNNTSTLQNPCHVFSAPGTYTVTLTSSNPCGPSTATQVVCITAPPVPAFSINNTTGCTPLAVTTNNTTNTAGNCAPTTWLWTVTYSATNCGTTAGWAFTNGTTNTSQNPQFIFNNPGTYTIQLAATNPCGTFTTNRTVIVKQPPVVTMPNFVSTCGTASISPTATVTNCGTTAATYAWSFPGGSPATSTAASPGTILYATPGNYTITLAVTNECGTTTITRNLIVNPIPAITVPAATLLCAGDPAGPFNFTSIPAGASFTWTNSNTAIGLPASGIGNIPPFTASNPGALPITAIINVTGSNGLCTAQQSFTITVSPKPPAPVVTSPVNYCLNATALPLTATATSGNTLLWYTVPVGGTGVATAPTPSTAATGNTIYYVNQVNTTSTCEGPRAAITVTVNAIPAIGTASGVNPSTCGASNGAVNISGLLPNTSYTVHYLQGGNPVTVTLSSNVNGIINITGLPAGSYTDIYVTRFGCNSALLGPVNLTNPAQPATPVVPAIPQMCSGGTLQLNASSTTGGVTYNWTGPNLFSSTLQNPTIGGVTVAASGTYTVTATAAGCVSLAGSVTVVINPTAGTPSVANNGPVCQGLPISLSASTVPGTGISYAWTGPAAYTSTQQNPVLTTPVSGSYTVIATATNNGQACPGLPASTNVLVKPVPQIIDSSFTNPTQCGQPTGTIVLQGLVAGTSYTVLYNYNTAPQNTNIIAAAGGIISIQNLAPGTYDNIRVVLDGCTSNIAGPFTLTNPSPPATPIVTASSPICSGGTINLTASTTSGGAATYSWTGPASYTSPLQNPSIPNATVAYSGTYQVIVTIAGCASAPATANVVVNQTPALPTAGSNSPVCTGNTLQLNSNTTTAGGMSYAWTGPNGFTSPLQNPVINTVTSSAQGTYTVVYTSTGPGACVSGSGTTNVVINPTPALLTADPTHPDACGASTGAIALSGLTALTLYTVNYTFNTAPQTASFTTNATGVGVIANLPQGTYDNFVVVLNGCNSNSLGAVILRDPNPPVTPVITNNSPVCSGNTLSFSAATTSTGSATYQWTGPNGYTGNTAIQTINNANVNQTGAYQVIVTIAGCASAPATANLVVNQTPATPTATSNSPVCTGNTLQLFSGTSTPGGMTYAWTGPNGFTSTDQNPVINNVGNGAAGTYSVIFTSAGAGACVSAAGNTLVAINNTPVLTGAVPTDPNACGAANGFITLSGLTASTLYTVNYTFNTSAQTTNLTSGPTGSGIIPNLAQGTYDNIVVVLAGCTSNILGPVNLTDPNPPATPIASSNSAICSGQTLNLFSNAAAGSPTYTWTGPNGFNSNQQNPSIATAGASNAGYYYVFVTVNNCNSLKDSALVVINPLGALPGVTTPINYCINEPSVALTATPAAGGTLSWYNVATGGSPLPSAPVPSTATAGSTIYYVSQSTPAGCEGARAPITVTINPDARAVFTAVNQIKCAPYVIGNTDIILQQFPANNSVYNWYANNIFIGAGTSFPGYTIVQPNDSIRIKLVAVSAFGCKSDSMESTFYTYKVPAPSFDVVDSVGCGPLAVVFTNTTPDIGLYNYFWDFGNGQTSTAQNPGTVIFPINPTYNDTVYTIKLKIETLCDTVTAIKYVRVKAPPRALFIPDRTTGCSPMRVEFANTSLGLNSTYYWDFGDGDSFVTSSQNPITHTYNTGVVDTFTVRLIAVNDCGADTQYFEIRVAPNNIALNFNLNGPDNFGCAPHTVAFINNSSGASTFEWNFGDGNTLSTTDNIDTVYHSFADAGVYNVTLTAMNSCTDTTATRVITVYPKPDAAFISTAYTICIGQSIQLTNQSVNATSYAWNFGDGNTSLLINPTHTYNTPGLYNIRLISFRNNPSGDVCIDTAFQQVQVKDTLPGFFTMSDSTSDCAPLTVTFVNRVRPSVTAAWNFGDGNTASGDSVVHTYNLPGNYYVDLVVTVPGGCTYKTRDTVTVNGPSGSFAYDHGFVCLPGAVMFTANAFNATGYTWNFGDGNTATTTSNTVYHTYANPGNYIPSVILQNGGLCNFPIQGLDTIKVDKIVGGFRYNAQQVCGSTNIQFADTSSAFFGLVTTSWNFGDGNTGSGSTVTHNYTASGVYNIEMIVTGASGCSDTLLMPITVQVNSIPVASIISDTERCANQNITFSANVVSTDPLAIQQWRLSNGVTATGPSFSYLFNVPGSYTIRFIAGTTAGCFDTAFHTIVIRPVPVINATASSTICLGNSVQLNVTGAPSYQWNPSQGLSCNTCPNPIATPTITTPYVVTGSNAFGCAAYDTVVVTVIQPMNLVVNPNINICIGQSANLLASGAASYIWSPGITLSSTTISNPIATPTATTNYRVVGYDGFNCFTDTAFVLVGVGRYPTVNLGPDLTLSTGTIHPLNSTVTNGPITQWNWTPATDLNCNSCPLPLATIKKDISYIVKVTTAFGCSATDTINIKTFCENSQVFIPNAFTPDGDGVNDILMVRGKGIVTVKFFRIFNRWGEIVFERSNFPPNIASYGWNGRVRGVVGPPDVFVYTAEVVCENGTTFVYKGNTSIIK